MLLKILVYGYLNNVYSARMIAKSVRENIYFRWIAGCQSPDFRTINTFRRDKLAPVINEVFVQVVKLLHKQGWVQLDTVYVDGTKIEARANRYTFVGDFLPRKQKYEYHREHFKGRSSYSKTGNDATFMRMKEDHMRNGQQKPGYNIQVGTESDFVTTYGIYSNPTDTRTLPSVSDKFNQDYEHYPENLIADKGYGSVDNYEDCEEKDIEAYIKHQHWDLEKKKRSKKYRYRWWSFKYNEEQDQFTRAENKKLEFSLKRYHLQQKARARL